LDLVSVLYLASAVLLASVLGLRSALTLGVLGGCMGLLGLRSRPCPVSIDWESLVGQNVDVQTLSLKSMRLVSAFMPKAST